MDEASGAKREASGPELRSQGIQDQIFDLPTIDWQINERTKRRTGEIQRRKLIVAQDKSLQVASNRSG